MSRGKKPEILVGLAIGILSALSVTRLMPSVLYAINTTDLPTFLGVAVFLMAVALAACYFRRGMRRWLTQW